MSVLIAPNTPSLKAEREKSTKCMQELMRAVLRGPSKDVFKLSKVMQFV